MFENFIFWTGCEVKALGGIIVFGLGKPRSKLGKFMDDNRITQEDLANASGVSRPTITRLCAGDAFGVQSRTANKIIKALRDLTGKRVGYDDFWSI
jgi:predicted transcriptional regulator